MADYPELYPYLATEAKRLGELEQWRESHRANIACKKAIEAAIRSGFDGMYLDADCVKGVVEAFGDARVQLVLANTLKEKSWDGRFSGRNREWFASTFVPPDPDHNSDFVVDSHPTVLDGFMDAFRALRQEMKQRQEAPGPAPGMTQMM